MQLSLPGEPHITYCTNIHAGETWPEIEAALGRFLPAIKRRISPASPMGIGLRLSAIAAQELAEPDALERFTAFLDAGGFYVFTINAFPYGPFHGQRVKEQVYAPDWRTPERLSFTTRVADIMAELLPDGMEGSISTVPGAFKAHVTSPSDVETMVEALIRCAAHLYTLSVTRNRSIVLALEPEPACFLETTEEAIQFFAQHLFSPEARSLFASLTGMEGASCETYLRRHLGLCFDACHSAVAFEDARTVLDAVARAGIRIPKLQISAALELEQVEPRLKEALLAFNDGVYLHQTVEQRDGVITRHTDLPDALAALSRGEAGGSWRIHCHVPVFLARFSEFRSTQDALREVLALCREREIAPHLEVETYTWDVLPPGMRNGNVGDDIVRELEWVLSELAA